MRKGYKTTIELLQQDIALEDEMLGLLRGLLEGTEDGATREALSKIEQREKKNIAKLKKILEDLERNDYEVKLICFVCNWWISFGATPADGDEGFCEECKLWFRLREVNGDFRVEKIGPKRNPAGQVSS